MNQNPQGTPDEPLPEDRPPILGSWRRLYTVVLLHLFFWIAVFYVFTVRFDLPQ